MYISNNIKSKIKLCIVCVFVVCMIAFSIFTVMRYEVEGEKKMPFKLGKIIVISSAVTTDATNDVLLDENTQESIQGNTQENTQENAQDGAQENKKDTAQENTISEGVAQENTTNEPNSDSKSQENYIWNEKVIQTNDLYIYIDKNNEYNKETIIKSVKIENIQILQNVKIGKVQVYMPNSLDDGLYKYTNDFLVNSTLTYNGASGDNVKNLEIGNQGGCVCISFANIGIGDYKSNDDTEIEQGAAILEKMNVGNDDLKFKVSFDLIIEVQDKSYKANIMMDLPVDDLIGNKETHKEITDFDDVIFKRM